MSFVAISKVIYPNQLREEMHSFGLKMLPLANAQPGFVSISFHQSTTENQTMMLWEWETEADHEACIKSPDWSELMASSGELFESEGVEFSLETYERLA